MGNEGSEKKLVDLIVFEVEGLSKRCASTLDMSQSLVGALLGGVKINPKREDEGKQATAGLIPETISIIKKNNEILSESIDNLAAILQQL